MNQYTHDQYFLAIINDQRCAKQIQTRVARCAVMKTAVRDMCWRLSQNHGLRPITTTENNALCDALTEYYRSETENTLARLERELKEWREGVRTITRNADNLTQPKEQNTMATNKPDTFQTKHLVNGVDVNELSDDHLIDAIKSLEKQTTELQTVKTESKKITARITSLNAQREAIVALLDSRP